MKWIAKKRDLEEMIDLVRGQESIAVDTEADSLHSYFDKVCLIQLSIEGYDFVIDPLAKLDLSGLGEVLADESIRKVFHGADYDLRILQRDLGFLVHNLTDTMVCAQLLGYEGVGLAALLEKHFGMTVDKSHQRADWAQRPLPPEMLRYATLDTHHLIELAGRLRSELEALGRWEWAMEEFERLEAIRYEAPDRNGEPWRKVKGSAKLERRSLAVLALLWEWRDSIAQRLDRPPFKVLNNEAMLGLAEAMPSNRAELETVRGIGKYHASKYGDDLITAIARARTMPESDLPEKAQSTRWVRDREVEKRIERLKKVRNGIAAELKVEPSVLAPRHVLSALAEAQPRSIDELESVPAMREWQKALVGQTLIEALSKGR